MLSSVLKSGRAVQMNVSTMRAFVRLRELMATHKDLSEKIEQLEKIQKRHGAQIGDVIFAVERLI